MDILNTIASIASIISLFITLFVANKVINIGKQIRVQGDKSMAAGRDIKIEARS